jgi:hypothetical protein
MKMVMQISQVDDRNRSHIGVFGRLVVLKSEPVSLEHSEMKDFMAFNVRQ